MAHLEKAIVNNENNREPSPRREPFSQPCDLVTRKGKTMVFRHVDSLCENKANPVQLWRLRAKRTGQTL